MSWFRASLIAAAATATLAAPARAQDPIDLSGFIEPSAPGDTTQLIDRVVAIVGDTALLRTEVLESILQGRSQGLEVPDPGTPAFDSLFSQTMYNLVDQLIILQKAEQQDLPMNDDVLERETDARFREIRNSFTSGAQFQSTVRESGRTLVQYRQMLRTQVRARMMIQSFLAENRDNLPPVAVTEEEIQEYFEEFFAGQTRPSTVTMEQVIIEPKPSAAAEDSALAVAEEALAELDAGEDFEIVARRYSDDPSNRDQGGDLGWVRRSQLVKEFANAAWGARTGEPIGPVRSPFGYHIIKVENVRGGERKVSHILISPGVNEVDVELARQLGVAIADSVRDGASIRDMVEHHGVADVPIDIPEIPIEEIGERLSPAYGEALASPIPGQVVGPFEDGTFARALTTFVIVQVQKFQAQGSWEIDEVREDIRGRLYEQKGMERFIEEIKKEIHVEILL